MTLALICFQIPASADYFLVDNEIVGQFTPQLFEMDKVYSEFSACGNLNSPTDLFVDKNGDIYILDAGNCRVVRIGQDGKFIKEYKGPYGSKHLPLNNPQGLYVNGNNIYIADTENGRIVHIDKSNDFIEEFVQPKEDTFDTTYPFKPTKISIDNRGVLYISNLNDYHGLITMDGNNKFLGYIAASKIQLSLQEKIIRTFASAEQKAQFAREIPPYISNFLIAPDNFIYTVSYWAKKNQIQKLTSAGNNIYKSAMYGEENKSDNYNGLPGFIDLAVNKTGFIFAADAVTNKIYIYDNNGNNIGVIGGTGNTKLTFNKIASVFVDDNDSLYVLDGMYGIVQCIKPTDFMTKVEKATVLTNDGEFEQAYPIWNEVKKVDSYHYMANSGIAHAEYRSGNYKAAMAMYKNLLDRSGYSQVFSDYRLQFIRKYFLPLLVLLLLMIALVFYCVKRVAKYAKVISVEPIPIEQPINLKMYGRFSLLIFFHPIDAFDKIKQNRKYLKIWPLIFLTLAIVVVRIVAVYTLHFPLNPMNVLYVDLWRQVAVFFVPLLSWVFINYAISAVSDGKQSFIESITTSALCFLPYIVLSLPLVLLSQIMCSSESVLYAGISNFILYWCIFLLIVSSMRMNEYSFGQEIKVILKTIFGILCFWMLVFLFYTIILKFVGFAQDVYFESTFLFM